MALLDNTYGHSQLDTISTQLLEIAVLAIATPTVTLYHHRLEMITSVTADIATTLMFHRPT